MWLGVSTHCAVYRSLRICIWCHYTTQLELTSKRSLDETICNARSAWWLGTSTYALGRTVTRLGERSSLARSKPKKFPYHLKKRKGVQGEAAKKLKGNFWLAHHYDLQKVSFKAPFRIEGFSSYFSSVLWCPRHFAFECSGEYLPTPTHPPPPRTGRSHPFAWPAWWRLCERYLTC